VTEGVDEAALLSTHVLDWPIIGCAGATHVSPGAQWSTYIGCSGWLHGCPTVEYAAHALARHHWVERQLALDVHELATADVVGTVVVVTAVGADVVEGHMPVVYWLARVKPAHPASHGLRYDTPLVAQTH